MPECSCKGSIMHGMEPSRETTYLLLLMVGRVKDLHELLLKNVGKCEVHWPESTNNPENAA